jgi:cystathionine beta-lyase
MRFDEITPRKGSGCFKYDALKSVFGSEDLIPLWVADMDFPVCEGILSALQNRLNHPIYGYNFPSDEFPNSLRAWMLKRHELNTYDQEAIAIPSLMTALAISILSLSKEGDGILIQTPVYPPFHSTVKEHKRQLLTNPLIKENDAYCIDWEDFEAKARMARMFILCNPHNPIGKVFSAEELREMHRICRKHDVIIFSDEIHADIVYQPKKHIPIASFGDDNVITAVSPAKSFNIAGLATAMMFAPRNHIADALKDMNISLHTFMGNSFGVAAFTAAYQTGESWLEELLKYLETNRDLLADFFAHETEVISMSKCEGTFLAWLDCRAMQMSDKELHAHFVHRAGLALNPGTTFGEEGSGHMRLNFACPKEVLEQALERLKLSLRNR